MKSYIINSKINLTIKILTILISIILIPLAISQASDTFTPIVESDLTYLSDLIDSSDEVPIQEHLIHKVSLLVQNRGNHQILGNEFNILPKYAIIDGVKSNVLNKEIYTKEINSYVTLEWDDEIYDCSYMFSNLSDIININFTEFNFKRVKKMNCMFCNNTNLQHIEFGESDTSYLISMEKIFYNCSSLTSLNLSSFDMRNVINMNLMFAESKNLLYINFNEYKTLSLQSMDKLFNNCTSLTSLNLSNFYTHKVTNMESLFYNCTNLNNIILNDFDIAAVTNMNKMFYNCSSLTSLNLSTFYGNEYINVSYMFYNCKQLRYINFSKNKYFHLNSMEYMFYYCYYLLSLDLSSFETSHVRNMSHMFYYCYYLNSLNLTNFYSLYDIDMSYMFYYCYSLDYIYFTTTKILYLNNAKYMFYRCNDLYYLDLISFDTSNVTNMDSMFDGCYYLVYLYNINFNISNVNSMVRTFACLHNLISLDLSNLISYNNIINMNSMFNHNYKLNNITFPKTSFLKSNNMRNMFYECKSLKSLDLSSFDTSLVNDMGYMFYYCYNLTSLNLSNFNTSLVNDMKYMFYACNNLTSLNLSNFNTSLVTDMQYMFYTCNKLKFTNVSSFNTTKVTNMCKVFVCCHSLTSLDLSNFDVSKVTDFRYMFDHCYSLKYLNIFNFTISSSFTPDLYGIFNRMNDYSNNYQYCLKEDNYFFTNYLSLISYATRDCSAQCYGFNKIYQSSTKKCTIDCSIYSMYEYNELCYDSCPKRAKASNNNKCELLNCLYYYNYEETDCLNDIPEGYYLNNTSLKTINKCPEKCKTCDTESVRRNLCISCNNSYYSKLNDINNINSYKQCYNYSTTFEYYYLDYNESLFKPCYNSCKYCYKKGDEQIHYCSQCDYNNNYNFTISIGDYFNCYKEFTYYYIDNITNKYYFIHECPSNHSKLIYYKKQCIDECYLDEIYKYEFKNECYIFCPNDTKISENKNYYCDPICPYEKPFEIISSQECVEYCDIYMLYNKLCRLNYNKTNTNKILSINFHRNIISDNFDFTNINNDEDIIFEKKNIKFIITKDNQNIKDLDECEYVLRNYYNTSEDEFFIYLIEKDNLKNNITFQIFYSFNDLNLEEINLNLCNYVCKEEKCSSCTQRSVFYDLCESCNDNYYQIINEPPNIYSYINCYKNPEGYYLDKDDSFYKPCYDSCKTCEIKGDEEIHNCVSCNNNFTFELNFEKYKNCYKECEYYFYYDSMANKYYCTKELQCPNEYDKLIKDNNECKDDCKKDDIYKYEFQKRCYTKCPENTQLSKQISYYCIPQCPKEYPFEMVESQQCVKNCSISDRQKKLCITNYISEDKDSAEVQDQAINNIREDLTSGFDTSDIKSGKDVVIEEKGTKLTITSTDNQKNSEKDPNTTTINLGECETKLKEHYNIPLNKSLYILKVDVVQEGMKIPKIEYEVYYPLKGDNLEKLNLSICDNTKVDISIPVEINDDLDKLNPSSGYYNDICYTSTSENGTDISLSDRKKEFVDNNKTLCEEDCEFIKYDYESGKAVCSCNIKKDLASMSDATIDKTKFFKGFADFNNIINYKVMKCIKNVFDKDSFKHNYGSFILLPLIVFHIVSIILASVSGFKVINNQIKEIIYAKQDFKFVESQYLKYHKIKKQMPKELDKEKRKKMNAKRIRRRKTEKNEYK